MKKEYIKYGFFTLIALVIFIFIYPTLYQYDKINQKQPVRINRITGNTEILYTDGWGTVENSVTKKSEIDSFRTEIYSSIKNDHDALKKELKIEITKDISDSILSNVKDKLASVEKEIGAYKEAQLDPNNSFTIGSTEDEVKKIMGIPTNISSVDPFDNWYYGSSRVEFQNKKVRGWSVGDKKLNIK